ncbi:MAG: 30S ribosomal protein S19e [Candidatus Aenigmarchaeota archaeon]|nr:30S ribosomal protein S19e [Candidatus Aenigmarchaeota archaeon]MDI6722721.1 30S ribosomal protein S19e [Candidatus Aenigmarchaeota archaeon]
MKTVHDVDMQKFNKLTASELKGRIAMPEWAMFVKTGSFKERPPEQQDWWYLRASSMLRRIYIDGPVGTSKLRTYYGGLHRRGHKPAHFGKASGKIIRTILLDLEKAGLIIKTDKPKKGRIITPEGQKFINQILKRMN